MAEPLEHFIVPCPKVLVNYHMIPVLNEMPSHVIHTFPHNLDGYVMPGHSSICSPVNQRRLVLPHVDEVFFPVINEVNPWPKL